MAAGAALSAHRRECWPGAGSRLAAPERVLGTKTTYLYYAEALGACTCAARRFVTLLPHWGSATRSSKWLAVLAAGVAAEIRGST